MELFQREMPLIEDNANNLLMHVNKHLERIHAMSSLTIDDLKQAILGDPVLKAALTGSTEQNYGGSLIKNGALELDTKQYWTGGDLIQNKFNGLKSIHANTNWATSSHFYVDNRCLYVADYYIDTSNLINTSLGFYIYDINGLPVNNTNGYNTVSPTFFGSVQNGSFTRCLAYFGGFGNTSFSLPLVAKKMNVFLVNNSKLNSLIVREVSLGEPLTRQTVALVDTMELQFIGSRWHNLNFSINF